MKKVLFVATITKHINAFHIPYLKWFKESGYEVHVASNGNEQIEYCDKHYNLPFERLPLRKNNLKTYRELKKIINENKYEIIHCHTPVGGVLTRLAAKKSRKKGTRVIYTAHGFHFYKGAPLLNWLIYYPIEKWMAKYTDTLITINEEDYELAKKNFKAKQIELVQGVGVNENKFNFEMSKEDKHKLRESLGLKDDDFVIIYVAELSKRKNQGMLIETAKKLINEGEKNVKIILPGKDSMNGFYQKMCKDLEIEENVKFLGYRKDIPQLLKISDLYVSTTKQEGLPVNIMEAMISGLPIITTDCRGQRDLIEDGKNGYLANDVRKFCKRIKEIMYKRELINTFSKNNIHNIEKYTIKKIMKEMEKIYIDVNN
ncbi:MAG: glycosyltransferase family 4 protein [Clostridia bacterium]|nr:glycosyltransferase family 4 protein [Clostridia bacterium]